MVRAASYRDLRSCGRKPRRSRCRAHSMPHISGLVASSFSSDVVRTDRSSDSPMAGSAPAARCQRRTKVATSSWDIRVSARSPNPRRPASPPVRPRGGGDQPQVPGKARTSSRSQRRAAARRSPAISSMPSTSSTSRRARRTRSTHPGGCSPATGQPTARRKSPGEGQLGPRPDDPAHRQHERNPPDEVGQPVVVGAARRRDRQPLHERGLARSRRRHGGTPGHARRVPARRRWPSTPRPGVRPAAGLPPGSGTPCPAATHGSRRPARRW